MVRVHGGIQRTADGCGRSNSVLETCQNNHYCLEFCLVPKAGQKLHTTFTDYVENYKAARHMFVFHVITAPTV